MALDGEAVIRYDGQEQVIHAGETFKFDKFGKHSVSATKQFKWHCYWFLSNMRRYRYELFRD